MVPLASFLTWLDGVERELMHAVTCRLYAPWLDPILLGVQDKWVAIPLALAAIVGIGIRRRRHALRVLLACAIGFGLAMLLADGIRAAVARQRPPHAYEHLLLTAEELATCEANPDALAVRKSISRSRSFPSRHGLTIGVFVTVFLLASRPLGLVALLVGLLAAVGRVYAAKHWPSDVLAGLVLGALVGWAVWRWLPAALDRVRLGWLVREPPAAGPPVGG